MLRSVLLLSLVVGPGCMRMHHLVSDGDSGVFFVSQKYILGIGGKQQLIHCAATHLGPEECSVVVTGPGVADLPVQGGQAEWRALEADLSSTIPRDSGPLGPAGGCPPDALAAGPVVDGTRLALVEIHPDDAYFPGDWRARLPVFGEVDGDLHPNDGCWMGGGFVSDSGESFYFYKAAFRLP